MLVPSTSADKMAEDVELEDACLRDSISIASTDSFVSAAEVSVHSHSPNRTCDGRCNNQQLPIKIAIDNQEWLSSSWKPPCTTRFTSPQFISFTH